MEQRNQRNTKRRLNSLILLVAFTAIMLIVSTYAWFSINKEVSITNLEGEVKVVPGLEISLDAKNWSQSLDLSKLDITSTTDAYSTNTNFKPSELLPVSTTGSIKVADAKTELPMYRGENTGVGLANITEIGLTSENKSANPTTETGRKTYPGYFAFDVFLKNSSEATDDEVLQLNSNSSLALKESGKETSGLQNTVRVGLAKFEKTVDVKAEQKAIIDTTTATTSYISDVAIWEPNTNAHIQNVVNNYGTIRLDSTEADKWTTLTEKDKTNLLYGFGITSPLPTFALTSKAAESGKNSIADIYDWAATTKDGNDSGKLAKQFTLQTATSDDNTTKTVNNLISANSTNTATTNFKIGANVITRVRVYVWLEGQDIDCINYASHGGGIAINLGLVKGSEIGSHEPGLAE